jgi:hypothetical protein
LERKGKKKKGRPLKRIMKILPNTPALGLPDMTKSFLLYVHERLGDVGVLIQLLDSWHFPVAYLAKQLDAISPGLAALSVIPDSDCCLGR